MKVMQFKACMAKLLMFAGHFLVFYRKYWPLFSKYFANIIATTFANLKMPLKSQECPRMTLNEGVLKLRFELQLL